MESHVKPVSCYHTLHRLLTLYREGWHARNDTPVPSSLVSFLQSRACLIDRTGLPTWHDYMKKDRQQSMQEPNFSTKPSLSFEIKSLRLGSLLLTLSNIFPRLLSTLRPWPHHLWQLLLKRANLNPLFLWFTTSCFCNCLSTDDQQSFMKDSAYFPSLN